MNFVGWIAPETRKVSNRLISPLSLGGKSLHGPAMSENTDTLRPNFWEVYPLDELSKAEWEALCDGCGKCCLLKLEDADTGVVEYTNVSCRLLDGDACSCTNYPLRKQIVPDCVVVNAEALERIAYWMPVSCAYRLLYEGKSLYPWHPLVCGDPLRLHAEGVSLRGNMISEDLVKESDLEDHIMEGFK